MIVRKKQPVQQKRAIIDDEEDDESDEDSDEDFDSDEIFGADDDSV